jgi:hypothetical protein
MSDFDKAFEIIFLQLNLPLMAFVLQLKLFQVILKLLLYQKLTE